jgi:hypothetical protein
MIANSGSILHEWQQQVVSKCFERRTRRHEQMQFVNAFWEVSGENAWIISWSCRRNSSTVSSKPMSGTTIKLGHIKGSGSRFPTHRRFRLLLYWLHSTSVLKRDSLHPRITPMRSVFSLCWLLGPSVLEKRYKTRRQLGALKKSRPLVSACHAGLLGDNRTPVGSARLFVQLF